VKGMARRSQNKGAEKALKIAKVAAHLFNSKGYLETNMDDIGNGARLSKGGIYHYFSSKDEILFLVLDNYMDVILEGLEETLRGMSDPIARIKFIISRHIDLYTKHRAESKTLLHEAHCLPKKYYKTIAEKERRYYQVVAQALAGIFGSESGVTKVHTTVLTFLLFGMCNWIYSWYDPKGTVPADELSERIFTVFLDGVRKYSKSGRN
jgi:AcrR family transcriptional regulator